MPNTEADGTSTLGSGVSIQGRITGPSSLTVEGAVKGEIDIEGDLVIVQGAQVHGSVTAAFVSVGGTLDGDVVATGPVHAAAGATLRGTVKGESFSMEDGALVAATVTADFDLPEELHGSKR